MHASCRRAPFYWLMISSSLGGGVCCARLTSCSSSPRQTRARWRGCLARCMHFCLSALPRSPTLGSVPPSPGRKMQPAQERVCTGPQVRFPCMRTSPYVLRAVALLQCVSFAASAKLSGGSWADSVMAWRRSTPQSWPPCRPRAMTTRSPPRRLASRFTLR